MELETGKESEVTLAYPSDANLEKGRVSILAPVGAALIGLRIGDEIEWPLPSGKHRTYRITSVLFQPEAEGHYHL
jgi:regulator of nucleoside diphosphate kinase